jgi:hypothetical protein
MQIKVVTLPSLPAWKCAYDPEQDSAIGIETKLNASARQA